MNLKDKEDIKLKEKKSPKNSNGYETFFDIIEFIFEVVFDFILDFFD